MTPLDEGFPKFARVDDPGGLLQVEFELQYRPPPARLSVIAIRRDGEIVELPEERVAEIASTLAFDMGAVLAE